MASNESPDQFMVYRPAPSETAAPGTMPQPPTQASILELRRLREEMKLAWALLTMAEHVLDDDAATPPWLKAAAIRMLRDWLSRNPDPE